MYWFMYRASLEAAQRQINKDFPLAVPLWWLALAASIAFGDSEHMRRFRKAE